jgi:hypothetical protein
MRPTPPESSDVLQMPGMAEKPAVSPASEEATEAIAILARASVNSLWSFRPGYLVSLLIISVLVCGLTVWVTLFLTANTLDAEDEIVAPSTHSRKGPKKAKASVAEPRNYEKLQSRQMVEERPPPPTDLTPAQLLKWKEDLYRSTWKKE